MGRLGARRSVGGMKRVLTGLAASVLLVSVSTACGGSGSGGGDDPTPVGGINGPARVDTDTGGANNGGGDD